MTEEKITTKMYGEFEVDFEPFIQKRNVMVNATQMAKIFGKQVNEFTSNSNTKDFIYECLKNGNSRFLSVEKEEDLIISKQKSGTWMHRVLALKFAAWLNPAFELWVYMTIEDLLFGYSIKTEKSISRTLQLQEEMKTLSEKEDKTGEDFERFLVVVKELQAEKSVRSRATRDKFKEMNDLFKDQF